MTVASVNDEYAAYRPGFQDRPPNFRADNGDLFLVRCFACGPEHGTENWAMAVADGRCAWCGWSEGSYTETAQQSTPRTVPGEAAEASDG